jgi:hypothetical protein
MAFNLLSKDQSPLLERIVSNKKNRESDFPTAPKQLKAVGYNFITHGLR